MKKLCLLFAICLLLFQTAAEAKADIMNYPRLAVMQFGNKAITSAGLREHDFNSASEYAIYQLSASGWFDLIDYEQLTTIARMHQINNSGLVDPATIVQLGKFSGAQFMIVGNVTGLTTKESGMGYQHGLAGGGNFNKHTVIANVAMRIVDIETGRIIVAGLGKGESASTHLEVTLTKYRNKKGNNTMQDYTNNMYANTDTNNMYANTDTNNMYTDTDTNNVYTDTERAEQYNEASNMEYEVNPYDYYAPETNLADEKESMDYKIIIGSTEVQDVQVRNAISKAVRDAIYGKMGLLTTLNGGKQLKIKTGF